MSSNPDRLERRAGQRFAYQIPVTIRAGNQVSGSAFTQDLSAKGVSFYTDISLTEGEPVELTLVMPSEITLGESMKVKCQGVVLRVLPSVDGQKFAVAVRLKSYEYLNDTAPPSISFAAAIISESAQREDDSLSAHVFNFKGANGR